MDRDSHSGPIPRLMNSLDMKIIKPSLLKLMTNQISARLIITPYFDNDFNLQDFKIGAKHAIVSVSSALANGDTTSLEVFLTHSLFMLKFKIIIFSIRRI